MGQILSIYALNPAPQALQGANAPQIRGCPTPYKEKRPRGLLGRFCWDAADLSDSLILPLAER